MVKQRKNRGSNSDRARCEARASHADRKVCSQRPIVVSLLVGIACVVVARFWIQNPSVDESASIVDITSNIPAPQHAQTVEITNRLDVDSVDVEKHRWPTEVLNDQIDGQFRELATCLSREKMSTEQLSRICAPSASARFHVATFVAHDDGVTQLERISTESSIPTRLHGIAEFARALAKYTEPRDPSTPIRVKFKIVDIQQRDGAAFTTVHVSFNQVANSRRWQQNDIWNCKWRVTDQSPLLVDVENSAAAFSRVTYQSEHGMLQDETKEVFSGIDCFQQQLAQDTNHWLSRIETAHGIDLIGSHGIAVADVNGDGLDDVYVCQPGGLPNRLFLANSQSGVVESAKDFGLDICDATQSSLFVDLDNDGDQDAVLVVRDNVFVLENPAGKPMRVRNHIRIAANPNSALAADFDNDGLLDLYILNHDAPDSDQGVLGMPIPFHDANNGGANKLLKNLGDFQFADVTADVGLDQNNRRFSLAGCWEDYDDDGDMDLYVANDFGRNNLYQNNDGTFQDVAAEKSVEDLSAGMSVSWGDVNNDGRRDLYIGNMFSSAGNRVAYQRDFHPAQSESIRRNFQRHARGNSLYVQTGGQTFVDQSVSSNVTMGRWAWSSKFADLNNDGREDILIANGFVTNPDTNDL